MPLSELLRIADAVIASIEPGALSEESLQKLQSVLPDNVILAALDLIDRDSVIKYITPWGYSQHEVLGSTATYSVFIDLPTSPMSIYCTCPAFAYAVLTSESHIMCKHVLATRLSEQMALCVERPVTQEDLASIMTRHYS